MADGGELAAMVDAEEKRVEDELQAEEQEQADAAENERAMQLARKADYHLHRFYEIIGVPFPENGQQCPTCQMGILEIVPVADSRVSRCEFCGGIGVTLTGSLVPGNETRTCSDCNGAGYKGEAAEIAAVPPVAETPQIPVIPYTPVEAAQVS